MYCTYIYEYIVRTTQYILYVSYMDIEYGYYICYATTLQSLVHSPQYVQRIYTYKFEAYAVQYAQAATCTYIHALVTYTRIYVDILYIAARFMHETKPRQ